MLFDLESGILFIVYNINMKQFLGCIHARVNDIIFKYIIYC